MNNNQNEKENDRCVECGRSLEKVGSYEDAAENFPLYKCKNPHCLIGQFWVDPVIAYRRQHEYNW